MYCFSSRVWAGLLAMLGFASCGDNESNGDSPMEYGTPTVRFQVQGKVTDEAGNPLKDIQVIIRKAYDNNPRLADTVYTDTGGQFESEAFVTGAGGPGYQKVYFNDVDDSQNGGTFKSDSIALEDMEIEKIEEGEGWNRGTYQLSTEIKLKKAAEEEQ